MDLIISISAFIILSILLTIYNNRQIKNITRKKKSKKNKEITLVEIKYLTMRFNLKKERLLNFKFALLISLINSFIISLVVYLINKIKLGLVVQMLGGFILLFGLIYALYEIVGRSYLRKDKKNDNKNL